jgi:hypothetical protein
MASVAAPTVEQILNSQFGAFTHIWAEKTPEKYDAGMVKDIFKLMRIKHFRPKEVMVLEFSCYLEHYLLPFLTAEVSKEHVFSAMVLVNEKFRENVPAWESWQGHDAKFPDFFLRVLQFRTDPTVTNEEKVLWVQFLINCFQSLEQDFVRASCLKVTNVQSWFHLNAPHRASLMTTSDKLRKVWRTVSKRYAETKTPWMDMEKNFLAGLLEDFLEGYPPDAGYAAMVDPSLLLGPCDFSPHDEFCELLPDHQQLAPPSLGLLAGPNAEMESWQAGPFFDYGMPPTSPIHAVAAEVLGQEDCSERPGPEDAPLKVFVEEYACEVRQLDPLLPAKKRPLAWHGALTQISAAA